MLDDAIGMVFVIGSGECLVFCNHSLDEGTFHCAGKKLEIPRCLPCRLELVRTNIRQHSIVHYRAKIVI